MQQFIEKYQSQIEGVISGFDRLVFRGCLRRLNQGWWDPALNAFVAKGMEEYLWQNGILFKRYQDHVKGIRERLKRRLVEPLKSQGVPVIFLRDTQTDKDELARKKAVERGLQSGTACLISALEPSPTFDHVGTHMVRRIRPCHVLYQYQIHEEFGWMHTRIQTWFPFNIQVAMNGREWLARQMDKEGLRYHKHDNCFPWLQDYQRAQVLLEEQLQSNWAELLKGFSQQLNPLRERVFELYPSEYYWTVYQSEWATDVVFSEGAFLKRLMRLLVRHSMLSYSSADVLRFFGRRLNQSGEIPAQFNGTVQVDMKRRQEGERVRFKLNGNSAKFYDKAYTVSGNVLRAAETTLNTVEDFRVYRPKEGGPDEDLQWRPMRKGIADLHRRAEVSQKANERLLQALASVDDSGTVAELTADIQRHTLWHDRRVRALRPWGEDHELLEAINHGEFVINGFRNRDLQGLLYGAAASTQEQRRRSAAISRKLRILRAHGLIHKVPCSHRYHVSERGRAILIAVLTSARSSVQQLNQLTQAA